MKAARLASAAAILVLVAELGCAIGQRPRRFPAVRNGSGSACRLKLGSQELAGELLSAEDTAAVLVINSHLWVVPYRLVSTSDCQGTGSIPFDTTHLLMQNMATDLKLRSRYPQGVAPDLLHLLLLAYGQTAPMVPDSSPRK